MSMEQIITTMDKLNMMHRSLLKLAYAKTEVLKTSNVDALDDAMKNEQSHIAAIAQLEQQRQQAVLSYFDARQIQASEATVTELLNYATAQEAAVLNQKRNELLLTIESLKQQNDLNQKMLFQSLQFVNFTLDLLKPQPDQINYAASSGERKSLQTRQFDSQA